MLKFHKFHIEYSEGCAYDSVTVYGKSDDTEEIKLVKDQTSYKNKLVDKTT